MTTPISTGPLLTQYPLRGLLIAQFFGAFNDNAWKLMVALLAIRQATAQMAPGLEAETAAQTQPALVFIVFTLPLMLLSLVGSALADRLSKRKHNKSIVMPDPNCPAQLATDFSMESEY